MELGYSFKMDNQQLGKGLKLLRIGVILYFVYAILAMGTAIASMFIINYYHYRQITVGTYICDSLGFIMIIIASFMFFVGLDHLARNLGGNAERMFETTKNIQLAFICLYIPGGLLTLIFNTLDPTIILFKNFLSISILTIMLFSLSINFNKLKINGYNTNLLLTPIVALPLPSLIGVGFSIGIIASGFNIDSYHEFILSVVYLNLYQALTILITFGELYFNLRKFALSMNIEFSLIKNRTKEPKEKKVKIEKSAPLDTAIPAKK